MILGRYLLISLGSYFKYSAHIINGVDGLFLMRTKPMVYLVTYDLKSLNTGKITHKEYGI